MTCPASPRLSEGQPDQESVFAVEGTDLHEVAAVCLTEGGDAIDFVGRPMQSGAILEEDQAEAVDSYVSAVRAYAAGEGNTLLVETAVPLTQLTGEEDAEGTLDFAVLRQDPELIVGDAKYGRGVAVAVEDNRQLKTYACALLDMHQLWTEYERVRLVVIQPRLVHGPQEWVISIPDLLKFKEEITVAMAYVKQANAATDLLPYLNPSEKACKFCRAKAICPKLTNLVVQATSEGFEDLTATDGAVHDDSGRRIGAGMDKAALVEIWLKGVRAAAEIELLAGRPVIGEKGPYKLVQGKKGNRTWKDAAEAEKVLKSFRMKVEEMYDLKVISPTTAEKRLAKEHPKRWEKVTGLYQQKDGSLSVAGPEDSRPAHIIEAAEAGFEEEVDCSDLI